MSGPSRMQRMLADPDLTGDLLLIGLAMAARLDFGGKWPKTGEPAREVFGAGEDIRVEAFGRITATPPQDLRMLRALRDDIRTYRISPNYGTCMAPMVRLDSPCGRRGVISEVVTDWATGEWSWLSACGRHAGWHRERSLAHRALRPDQVPLPPANSGGVLAKHFPEINWPKFWRSLDPGWVEHPEVVPWPKPTLTLLLGDDTGKPDVRRVRPALTVVVASSSVTVTKPEGANT